MDSKPEDGVYVRVRKVKFAIISRSRGSTLGSIDVNITCDIAARITSDRGPQVEVRA